MLDNVSRSVRWERKRGGGLEFEAASEGNYQALPLQTAAMRQLALQSVLLWSRIECGENDSAGGESSRLSRHDRWGRTSAPNRQLVE